MTDIANTIINVKVLDNSITLPKYETISSAGMDIRAFIPEGIIEIKPQERKLIRTGLCLEIPKGYEVQLRPRSGLALKNGITVFLSNEVSIVEIINIIKRANTVKNKCFEKKK